MTRPVGATDGEEPTRMRQASQMFWKRPSDSDPTIASCGISLRSLARQRADPANLHAIMGGHACTCIHHGQTRPGRGCATADVEFSDGPGSVGLCRLCNRPASGSHARTHRCIPLVGADELEPCGGPWVLFVHPQRLEQETENRPFACRAAVDVGHGWHLLVLCHHRPCARRGDPDHGARRHVHDVRHVACQSAGHRRRGLRTSEAAK
jgi:hypothetical protein